MNQWNFRTVIVTENCELFLIHQYHGSNKNISLSGFCLIDINNYWIINEHYLLTLIKQRRTCTCEFQFLKL